MKITLDSIAEQNAIRAEALPAFGGLQLLHVKRQLAELMKLIGRNGIFDEYTAHDISHVDKMLALVDWLIPESTKEVMSPADWLMIVLAVYFHDVGLLVTRDEFARRGESDFSAFVDSLYCGEHGEDYKHRISTLKKDDLERFLYQEFVRHHHAERVRWWITSQANSRLGASHEVIEEIEQLLSPLPSQFRRDMGFVAESHHLDDLDDLKKYRTSQPYGDSDEETANLQYTAVLLRVADLLHITGDRTPGVTFRLVNPLDPISQREWAKQMAVTRVRSQIGVDGEGHPDPGAPRDTIEVHAYFKKEDGFFGLTAYLEYASHELARCYEWIGSTVRRKLAPHEFPWANLDDSNLETEGFVRDAFQFTMDQAKILDLLTGHTLYNDSSVVLRELVQNSLDAIRLKKFEDPESSEGRLQISWNSSTRTLSVRDDGVGMTQDTIRNHLLKVGASIYQDPGFKKSHPGFSSISRFGIGVLSAFMIADSVEIITCHPDDEKARRLALRSVHGKYLVRLLDKSNPPASEVGPHGTLVRLHVRQSVEDQDFLEISRKWILIPGCSVTVEVDSGEPIAIGFQSPKEAIVEYLEGQGFRVALDTEEASTKPDERIVCVKQAARDGVVVAYTVKWSPYFHEWSFMAPPRQEDAREPVPVGTCIEGIRIDSDTPGFGDTRIMALANAQGESAPKTNVARSGLEATAERDLLLEKIYGIYCEHADHEIRNLTKRRGHSLTWAVEDARILIAPLLRTDQAGQNRVLSESLLMNSIENLTLHLVETDAGRIAFSPRRLSKETTLWTITSPLIASSEALIRQVPVNASIRSVVKALGAAVDFPDGPILCQSRWGSHKVMQGLGGREVIEIRIKNEERRLDLKWANTGQPSRWLLVPSQWMEWVERLSGAHRRRVALLGPPEVAVLNGEVLMTGLSGEMALRKEGTTFYIGEYPAIEYIRPRLEAEIKKGARERRLPPVVGILAIFQVLVGMRLEREHLEQRARRASNAILGELPHYSYSNVDEHEWRAQMHDRELMAAIVASEWSLVDPILWEERDEGAF